MVADKGPGHRHQIDVAMEAGHAPHILPLKVGPVAPAIDAYRHLVLTRMYQGSYVILRIIVRPLPVAGETAVDPHRGAAVNTVEVDEYAFVLPLLGQHEGAAVEAGGIVAFHSMLLPAVHGTGRIVMEGIAVVVVDGLAIAGHLPVERHLDGVPVAVVVVLGLELAFPGSLVGTGDVAELPGSVQAPIHGPFRGQPGLGVMAVREQILHRCVGDEGCVSGFPSYAEHVLVRNPGRIKLFRTRLGRRQGAGQQRRGEQHFGGKFHYRYN